MKTFQRALSSFLAFVLMSSLTFVISHDFSEIYYFPVKEGQTMKFQVTLFHTAQKYSEIVIKGADNSESFMTIIDRSLIRLGHDFDKPLIGTLELQVGKSGGWPEEYAGDDQFIMYDAYKIDIIQDTFGLYSGVDQMYWLGDMMGSSWYEVCQYDNQYIGQISTHGYQMELSQKAYSTKPLYICSFSEKHEPRILSLNWQSAWNTGYTKLPEFPDAKLVKMERRVDDEWFYDNWFKEESWFIKGKGLVRLSQTTFDEATVDSEWADGGTTMVWDRIF